MSNLADLIEHYLRTVLVQKNIVELQRRDLARMFRCAPSQINYVLETRFTLNRGYIVESKRGGGGYIRITQIQWPTPIDLPQLLDRLIPELVEQEDVEKVLLKLADQGIISSGKAQLILLLMSREFADLPRDFGGQLRAKFIKTLSLILGSIVD